MKIKFKKKEVSLTDCPVGLFILNNDYTNTKTLCVKTKYKNDDGGIDAYILSTGEKLSCNGKTSNSKGCDKIKVYPARKNKKKFIK